MVTHTHLEDIPNKQRLKINIERFGSVQPNGNYRWIFMVAVLLERFGYTLSMRFGVVETP